MENRMANLVMVEYVGAKPYASDNVARSGKVWNGNGDVQEVTPAQARILTKYPDQWKLVDQAEAADIAVAEVKVTDEDGDLVVVEETDLRKPMEKMTKTELKALALARFGKNLDSSKPRKFMIDQIEEWESDMDPLPGAPRIE
jgi:hypothetical protein